MFWLPKRSFPVARGTPSDQSVGTVDVNHHLWINEDGTWWIRFNAVGCDNIAERIELSLATSSVQEARQRRDALFRNEHEFSVRIDGIEETQ